MPEMHTDCWDRFCIMFARYCFIGVPLFAMVLGSAADFQIDRMMELRIQVRNLADVVVRTERIFTLMSRLIG